MASCQADPTCMWDPTVTTCYNTCRNLEQQALCTAMYDCRWKPGVAWPCDMRCSMRGYTNNTACDGDPDCMWDFRDSTNHKRCSDQPSESLCLADDYCEWRKDSGGCFRQCTTLPTESWCSSDDTCLWNTTGAACTKRCELLYGARSTCETDYRCMWDKPGGASGVCRKTCYLLSDKVCQADAMCQFDNNGKCIIKCRVHYDAEPQCDADPECQWDYRSGQCNRNCDMFYTIALCNVAPTCMWVDGNCRQQCPYRWASNTTCNNDTQCIWDSFDASCTANCAGKTDATTCEANSMCRHYSLEGVCAMHCALEYNGMDDCNADSHCMWDASSGTCAQRCETLYSHAECDSSPVMCTWDPDL